MLVLHLRPVHDDAIRTHGQGAYPDECCGLLLGRDEGETRRVEALVPASNDREQTARHNRFVISPEAFLAADKAARQQGLDVLGFYHSHPNAPARPSSYDLEHAWPVYSYLIVEVRDGRAVQMTSWVLHDDRSTFDPQPLKLGE